MICIPMSALVFLIPLGTAVIILALIGLTVLWNFRNGIY